MTAKRFEFREINEPPILPKCYDTEKQEYANLFECVGWLNELHEEKKQLRKDVARYRGNFREIEDVKCKLAEENEQLKQQLECQQEAIVNAIDSLMDLPSTTLYLLKQWLDTLEDFDSIEDMKNTFSERIKELEE